MHDTGEWSEERGDDWLRRWAASTSDHAVIALSPEGNILSWNPGGQTMHGYPGTEILGRHVSVLYADDDCQRGVAENVLREARQHGRHEFEGWRRRKGGELFWASVVTTAVFGPDGHIEGFVEVLRDISDKRKAHEAVIESERRFRLLVDGVTDYSIFMLSPEGNVTNWNQGARRIKGYTAAEIIGSHFSRFYTAEDVAAGLPAHGLKTAAREGRWESEGLRVRRDGSTFWAHVIIDAIREQDGTLVGFAKITRDITEKRQADELLEQTRAALFQAQKMEAIGKLTGGVAHDFNNVLQVLRGNIELLQSRHRHDGWSMERLGGAIDAVERGAKLASQLLAFGRRQALRPVAVNLAAMVRGSDDLLRRVLGETIEIETVVAGGLWNTQVDPHQLENVILNLAINARDAMPQGGKLTLELANAMLDDHYVRSLTDVPAGQYVMLGITDTGTGMSREVLERAFDPFFTTKPEGEGTGLGLSMAYGFVKQSGGHIRIYSEVGHGTTVRIYLPRSLTESQLTAPRRNTPLMGGQESILVVEDDLNVQATVIDILIELGYSVLKADNAEQALAVLSSGARVDLLFTDVVMPGNLRSPELARQAVQQLPHLKVLFTSGYTQNAIVHGGRLDPGVELLSKPYSREDLARKVRQVLGTDGTVLPAIPSTQSPPSVEPSTSTGLHVLVVEDDAPSRDAVCELLTMLGHRPVGTGSVAAARELLAHRAIDVLMTDMHLPDGSGLDMAREAAGEHPDLRIVVASGDTVPLPDALPGWQIIRKPYGVDELAAALDACRRM